MDVESILVFGIPAVMLTTYLTSIIKGWLGEKSAPLAAIVVGIVLILLSKIASGDITMPVVIESIVTGLMVGVMASGLYSGVKTISSK